MAGFRVRQCFSAIPIEYNQVFTDFATAQRAEFELRRRVQAYVMTASLGVLRIRSCREPLAVEAFKLAIALSGGNTCTRTAAVMLSTDAVIMHGDDCRTASSTAAQISYNQGY